MAFGVGAAAAPGHGTPGSAARTRQLGKTPLEPSRNACERSTVTGYGKDARAPRAPTPNAGAARVLGRAPRPGTSALPPCHSPHRFLLPAPALGDTRPVAVDVTVALPGGDPGRFLRQEPDDALAELARSGNVAAFEAIYDRHHRGLIAFCRHMLQSREEAEDALQHTFAAAYRALTCAGDRPAALKAWLYTIARNRCLTVLRARRTREAVPDTPADGTVVEGLADAVQRRADLRDLVEDLHRLPEDQRAALVLFELGDHSHAEIAEVLDVERAKVKALVFQAREGLLRARTARDTPCAEIRRHLSSRTRALPRRGVIRGHLDCCAACAAFDLDVRRQRAALAIVMPVVPSLELRGSVLAPLAGGGATVAGGGAALAGGGAGAGASGVSMTAAAGLGTGGAGVSVATLSTGAAGTIASAGAAASGLGAFAAKAVVAKVITAVAVAGAAGGSVHHARAVHHHAARPAVAIVAPAQATAADRPRAG